MGVLGSQVTVRTTTPIPAFPRRGGRRCRLLNFKGFCVYQLLILSRMRINRMYQPSAASKADSGAAQTGQQKVSGRLAKAVPAGMFCSGAPVSAV